MTNIRISITRETQPLPIMPPGEVMWLAHDFMADDPRHSTELPYVPRVYQTRYTIPEAFKFIRSESQKMTYEWAKLWYDIFAYYCPKHFRTSPADLSTGDWTWLNGFVPESLLDQWWLHLIHDARAFTNKTGPNVYPYMDVITGYGSGLEPFKKELVTTGGNYLWRVDGSPDLVWCLDGLAPAPDYVQLLDLFFLIHIATQCTPNQVDPTPRPGCPNGTWEIIRFPQAGGNIVVHPIISVWEDGAVMEWEGLHLRQNRMDKKRILNTEPALPYPYIPDKPLRETP